MIIFRFPVFLNSSFLNDKNELWYINIVIWYTNVVLLRRKIEMEIWISYTIIKGCNMKYRSIKTKLNLFFLLLTILPLIIVGLVSNRIISSILTRQIEERSNQYIIQSMQAIDMNLTELDNIMVSSLLNRSFLDALKKGGTGGSYEQEMNNRMIEENLRSIANTRKDIAFLMVERQDGRCYQFCPGNAVDKYSSYIRKIPGRIFQEDSFMRGKISWCGFSGKAPYILGVRKIMDSESLEELGNLYILVREESIQEQYASLKTTEGSFFLVCDKWSNVVLDPAREVTGTAGDNSDYYTQERISNYTGWSISQFTPKKELKKEIQRMQMIVIGMILVIISILLVIMNRFSNYLTRPIDQLRGLMKEIKHENFDIQADENRQDEFGQLARSFNSMAARIKQLIEEDYKSKILIQEAEYKFLRAQINPHFLYNTLDSISWMAAMDGNKDISSMSVALGRILRWSISNKDNTVSLGEEIKNVEDYLTIQQMRYGESFHYYIYISEEQKRKTVPKMIVQPLAENALIHGLEQKEGEKLIIILTQDCGDYLEIKIADNGLGMDTEKARKILEADSEQLSSSNQGVGVYNVHKRIQMMYGENYGLHITSEPGRGTEASIYIPNSADWEGENGKSFDRR